LRGMTLAVALYQPQGRETFKLIFRGTEGQVPFEFGIQIVSAVLAEVQSDSTIKETEIDGTNPVLASEGWVFIASPITSDVLVYSQGVYKVFLSHASDEQYVGIATFVHIAVPPYTPQQITALKSDPLATKFVRLEIKCNVCHGVLKAYAGIERSSSLESQGFRWNLEIDQDEFICSCGKTRFSMTPIKTGLHGLLQRNINPQTQTNISSVQLYEKTTLEQHCRELLQLIEAATGEEKLQLFLESHPIFFHVFQPTKIVFKPPILTKYFADFAILNGRQELLLIEIERPQLKMLKKDGGNTAELEHAFHQVRTWKQVLDDHKIAALEAIGDLKVNEVAKVKGVVVAGRKPSDGKFVRMLRSLSNADIELFTYDDLLHSVTELIKHVANV